MAIYSNRDGHKMIFSSMMVPKLKEHPYRIKESEFWEILKGQCFVFLNIFDIGYAVSLNHIDLDFQTKRHPSMRHCFASLPKDQWEIPNLGDMITPYVFPRGIPSWNFPGKIVVFS